MKKVATSLLSFIKAFIHQTFRPFH
jgi:hypothetical protein